MLGIIVFKGDIAFRATKKYGFGAGGFNHFNIPLRQFAEGVVITTPQGIVTATAFVITEDRLDPHFVEQFEHAAGGFQRRQIQMPEGHIEKRQTAHKLKTIPAVSKDAGVMGPGGPPLF